MILMRLDKEKNLNKPVKIITFEHGGYEYTITPEYIGFRVHKHSLDDELCIFPACGNEIVIK